MRVRLAIIGLVQQPAELRTHAENREIGAGDDLGADRLSGVLEKQIDGRGGATEDAVEDVGLVVHILEERVRLQVAAAPPVADEGALPVQEDELPGIPNREHAKQRLIDQGKDRRVRANAKTDRQQRRQRESAVLPQRTKTQTDVAREVGDHAPVGRRPVEKGLVCKALAPQLDTHKEANLQSAGNSGSRTSMPDDSQDLEARFFDLSIDMLAIARFTGYFKRLNPAWEKTLGFSREELLSKPMFDFVHPDDRARTLEQNRKVRAGGQALSFENRYVCKDGSYRWLLWNSTADPEHELIYAVARDITARKQAEEERERLVRELQVALAEVKELQTILPICMYLQEHPRRRKLLADRGGVLLSTQARTSATESVRPVTSGSPRTGWMRGRANDRSPPAMRALSSVA